MRDYIVVYRKTISDYIARLHKLCAEDCLVLFVDSPDVVPAFCIIPDDLLTLMHYASADRYGDGVCSSLELGDGGIDGLSSIPDGAPTFDSDGNGVSSPAHPHPLSFDRMLHGDGAGDGFYNDGAGNYLSFCCPVLDIKDTVLT
jgi:hypothetical protein